MSLAMFWQVGWSLVLGFMLSAAVQVLVPREKLMRHLGRNSARDILLAMGLGAISSSCSYAAASVSKSMFQKGAAFIPSLAFLMSATNLVLELGIILWVLLGWQFALAQWVGGVVMVVLMSLIVRLTYPLQLIETARSHLAKDMELSAMDADDQSFQPLWQRFGQRETWSAIAQSFVMDTQMLWQDLALGFIIAGCLSAWIPAGFLQTLFIHNAPVWQQILLNSLIGPLVAVLSFVCSIGNVPMAAVLWASGIRFSGVLSFLFADLIVLPLLDVYRRYYGWKMAVYIGLVFYVVMVLSGILVATLFEHVGWAPVAAVHTQTMMDSTHSLTLNYTFWLNIIFAVFAITLFILNRKRPHSEQDAHACCHHH